LVQREKPQITIKHGAENMRKRGKIWYSARSHRLQYNTVLKIRENTEKFGTAREATDYNTTRCRKYEKTRKKYGTAREATDYNITRCRKYVICMADS
jgi:hypothetical protein